MAFVLDSSVALAWLLPDETNVLTDALADRLELENACVPPIWSLEVGNALITALRRKRISEAQLSRSVSALTALPLEVDADARLVDVLSLAKHAGLTSYDAAYLEVAQRRGLPLATLDQKLRQAGRALKLTLVP